MVGSPSRPSRDLPPTSAHLRGRFHILPAISGAPLSARGRSGQGRQGAPLAFGASSPDHLPVRVRDDRSRRARASAHDCSARYTLVVRAKVEPQVRLIRESPARPKDRRLHVGDAIVSGRIGRVPARAEIRVTWSPRPYVEFVLTGGGSLVFTTLSADEPDPPDLMIDLGVKGAVTGRGFTWEFPPGGRKATSGALVRGMLDPCSLGSGTLIQQVEFGLVNLEGLHQDATLEEGGWRLVLQHVGTGPLGLWEGFWTTHRATLSRLDGTTFTAGAAELVLECLTYCLAFASEGWVGVVTPSGRGAGRRVRWQRWDVTTTDEYTLHSSWLPYNIDSSLALARLWTGFWRRWQTPEGQSAVRTLVPIFVEAAHMKTPEARLVLDQVGLELLSWIVVVEEAGMISGEGHDKLTAADRIRLLLTPSGVDLGVPTALAELASAAPKGSAWTDGAHAVTEIRNGAVHARKRRQMQVSSAALEQAGRLAHNYWLRGLLRYFGYDWKYRSRLMRDVAPGLALEVPGMARRVATKPRPTASGS